MEADVGFGAAEFSALFGRVASDPDWIRRVSREITNAIHRELPELRTTSRCARRLMPARSAC
jgi:hypothetical protein